MSRSPSSHAEAPPPTEPEAVEAELVRAFHNFFRAYAERRAGVVDALRERMSPTVTGFGTGRDERFTDRDTMLRILREELEQQPDPFSIEFVWTEARLLAPSVGVADAEAVFSVPEHDGEFVCFDVRLSVVLRLEDGAWRVAHNHGSMAASEQPEGDRTPIDGLKARNQELERLVDERTASLREAQAQLVHQEKMASLGALTAGIAHEIKNPLNFVTNFAALSRELVDELAEVDDPAERDEILGDLRANAEKIEEHGRRADGIVRSMMEHARSGTGERRAVDLNALVAEYAGHAEHAMRARHPGFEATLALRLDDGVGEVELVPQEIGRVLVNLVDNALDAIRQHVDPGAAPEVTVSTRRTEGGVEVRVSDNGPGMAPEVAAKVFEPFFTTKPTGEGTGLGLSLAHDIVAQGHGGALAVESAEGEGSAFTLRLPAA